MIFNVNSITRKGICDVITNTTIFIQLESIILEVDKGKFCVKRDGKGWERLTSFASQSGAFGDRRWMEAIGI